MRISFQVVQFLLFFQLHGKGRKPIAKKRKGTNSTSRDPSHFEIVEASFKRKNRKDGKYDDVSPQIITSTLVEDQISTFNENRRLMSLIDLNILLDSCEWFSQN